MTEISLMTKSYIGEGVICKAAETHHILHPRDGEEWAPEKDLILVVCAEDWVADAGVNNGQWMLYLRAFQLLSIHLSAHSW